MAVYRMDVDGFTLLRLALGGTFFCGLIFLAGAVVGYSLSTPPDEGVSTPEVPVVALAVEGEHCPEVPPVSVLLADAPDPAPAPAEPEVPIPSPEPVRVAESLTTQAWVDVPTTRELDPPPPASRNRRYAVQVGAFSVRGNADALAEDLRQRGYEPLVITARSRTGEWLEHVHLSVHPDEAVALAAADTFRSREQLAAVVVPALPPPSTATP